MPKMLNTSEMKNAGPNVKSTPSHYRRGNEAGKVKPCPRRAGQGLLGKLEELAHWAYWARLPRLARLKGGIPAVFGAVGVFVAKDALGAIVKLWNEIPEKAGRENGTPRAASKKKY